MLKHSAFILSGDEFKQGVTWTTSSNLTVAIVWRMQWLHSSSRNTSLHCTFPLMQYKEYLQPRDFGFKSQTIHLSSRWFGDWSLGKEREECKESSSGMPCGKGAVWGSLLEYSNHEQPAPSQPARGSVFNKSLVQ